MELNSKERQKIYDRWHKDLGEIKNDSLGMLRSLHKKALKHLDLNKDSKLKLLDLACGKGLFLKELELSNYKLDLYGVDISKVAIDKAKRHEVIFAYDKKTNEWKVRIEAAKN